MLVDLKEQQEIVEKYRILVENLKKWQTTLQQEVDSEYRKPGKLSSFTYNESIIQKIKNLIDGQ